MKLYEIAYTFPVAIDAEQMFLYFWAFKCSIFPTMTLIENRADSMPTCEPAAKRFGFTVQSAMAREIYNPVQPKRCRLPLTWVLLRSSKGRIMKKYGFQPLRSVFFEFPVHMLRSSACDVHSEHTKIWSELIFVFTFSFSGFLQKPQGSLKFWSRDQIQHM